MAPNIEVIDDFTAEGNIRAGSLTILNDASLIVGQTTTISLDAMSGGNEGSIYFEIGEETNGDIAVSGSGAANFEGLDVGCPVERASILPLVSYSKSLTERYFIGCHTRSRDSCSR